MNHGDKRRANHDVTEPDVTPTVDPTEHQALLAERQELRTKIEKVEHTRTRAAFTGLVVGAIITILLLVFILQNLAGTVFLSQIGSVAAITGAAIAIGLLGEQGSLSMLLAALCIVSGVLLVAWRGAKEARG